MKALCQVCGTDIEEATPVVCEVCETPHHTDCYQYLRRCSTYACTGLAVQGPEREATLVPMAVAGGPDGTTWQIAPPFATWHPALRLPLIPKGCTAMRLATEHLPDWSGWSAIGEQPLQSQRQRDAAAVILGSAVILLGAAAGGFVPLVAGAAAVPLALAAMKRSTPKWLVRTSVFEFMLYDEWPVPGRWRSTRTEGPLQIVLHRNLAAGQLSYVLALEWGGTRSSVLTPPIGIATDDRERADFLARLASARRLGTDLAQLLVIPYREQLLNKHAS